MVKEKVWQYICDMIHIHKGWENSTLIPSQRLYQHASVQSVTDCVSLAFQTMPQMSTPHNMSVCGFTLPVVTYAGNAPIQ